MSAKSALEPDILKCTRITACYDLSRQRTTDVSDNVRTAAGALQLGGAVTEPLQSPSVRLTKRYTHLWSVDVPKLRCFFRIVLAVSALQYIVLARRFL